MAVKKFDGLIEAVRFGADGKILMVRAYERRGATFSDHVLIDRLALVERLKKGQKFVTGQRKPLLGSTFDVAKDVSLAGDFVSTRGSADRDVLEDVPVF